MTKSAIGLPAQVAQNLLQRIISHEIPPGSAMPTERELQEHYSVSRTVVREAIKSLEARGLISNNGSQGAVVSSSLIEPSMQALLLAFHRTHVTIGDLLTTRLLLEPHIAAGAAASATEVQIRGLHALNRSMESMLPTTTSPNTMKTRQSWARADSRFHVALAEASQNPLLTILIEILVGIAWEQHGEKDNTLTLNLMEGATDQHNALTHAVAQHDVETARRVMIDHLESTRLHTMSQPGGLEQLIQMQLT